MEFEKTLFRVHEKFLSSEVAKKSIHAGFYLCLILGFSFDIALSNAFIVVITIFPLFIYANINYNGKSHCLQHAVDKFIKNQTIVEAMKTDYVSYIKIVSLTKSEIDQRALNNTPINETEILQFFQFSANLQAMNMNSTIRQDHNFTEVNFTIPMSCYANSSIEKFLTVYFFELETILINEIIAVFRGIDCNMKNQITGEMWIWTTNDISSYEYNSIFTAIIARFFGLIKLIFGYFLCSNITAIYTKITVICAPIFILITYSCCINTGDSDQSARLNVYRAFPWIGIYLYALFVNGQRKQSHMIFAIVCMVVIFYCLYLSSIIIWSALLFYKSIPKGLDQNFYGFIACLEFATLILIRTRSSIKWFPRISALVIISFLYYVQFTPYGFFNIALYLLIVTVSAIFTYHIITFEIPALNWNPFHHYTPSIDSPRTLFFPAFSLSWYHDLPQIWTMFYPLFGRSRFTRAQLAMVDRNTMLLHQTLQQAFQRGQNLHQEEIDDQNNDIANNGPPANNRPPANNQSGNSENPSNTNNSNRRRSPLNNSQGSLMIEIGGIPSSHQQPQIDRQDRNDAYYRMPDN